jgi:hypothetical protein
MFIVVGKYSWRRRVLAYRNDFCLTCEAPTVAFQHRTFDAVYLYWIPILPLGFRRRWHCGVCGRDPHANPRTRTGFKWVGVALLALITGAAWSSGQNPAPGDEWLIWVLRIGGLAATALAVWATLRSNAPLRLDEHLRTVLPNEDRACPSCRGEIVESATGRQCLKCGLVRDVVRPRG